MFSKLIAATITVMIVTVAVIALYTLPNSGTMFSLETNTEIIDFKVFNPESNRISLRTAWNARSRQCIQNLVITPKQGATIGYSRRKGGPLYIYIDNVLRIQSNESKVGNVKESIQLVLDLSLIHI